MILTKKETNASIKTLVFIFIFIKPPKGKARRSTGIFEGDEPRGGFESPHLIR